MEEEHLGGMPMNSDKSWGALELEEVLPTLAKSERACESLSHSIGERGDEAVEMLKSGKLEGELGSKILDILDDAILNDAEPLCERADHLDPAGVNQYEGVYWAWCMDYKSNTGYFLSEAGPYKFIAMNW